MNHEQGVSVIMDNSGRTTAPEPAGNESIRNKGARQRAEMILSMILVVTLSGFSLSLFLPFVRISIFAHLSIYALLIWRFVLRYKPVGKIPGDVILFSLLFFFTLLISALRSSNQPYAFYMFDQYKYFLLGGLLFTAPLSAFQRKIILGVLFAGAALDGLAGILQFYDILDKGPDRPHGFAASSTIFTARLAFIPATALLLLMIKKDLAPRAGAWSAFLVLTAVLTSGGILLSGGRGTWIAFAAACVITLLLFSPKKALLFALGFLAVFSVMFFSSGFLRGRAITTITSIQSSGDQKILTGDHNRLELWKGSLLLVQESPLMGIGVSDFQVNIERLIREKRLQEMYEKFHAHNIFLQVLATQGITGFVVLLGLIIALIRWGLTEIRERGGVGGYIIILCTLLTLIGGLTGTVIGLSRYVPTFFLIVGLTGSVGFRSYYNSETAFVPAVQTEPGR